MLPACAQEFLVQQQITDISCIEQSRIRSFYEWLQIRPLQRRPGALSEMMIYHYMYALKTFFSWAEVTGQLDYNPISGMRFSRPPCNSRPPLTPAQIGELFRGACTLQERAVLHLFYSCGLRRSEGEALDMRDVLFKQQLLYVRQSKGAKRRVVPLTATVAGELEAYCHAERYGNAAQTIKDKTAFMLHTRGGRMRGEGYLRIVNRLSDRAGLNREISLHHLRHSIATHLLCSGMSLEYVRDFLGHSFLESTQIYARADSEQIKSI